MPWLRAVYQTNQEVDAYMQIGPQILPFTTLNLSAINEYIII